MLLALGGEDSGNSTGRKLLGLWGDKTGQWEGIEQSREYWESPAASKFFFFFFKKKRLKEVFGHGAGTL